MLIYNVKLKGKLRQDLFGFEEYTYQLCNYSFALQRSLASHIHLLLNEKKIINVYYSFQQKSHKTVTFYYLHQLFFSLENFCTFPLNQRSFGSQTNRQCGVGNTSSISRRVQEKTTKVPMTVQY